MATKRKTTAKRTRYTDEFRATAVASAIAAGYPSVKGALSHAAASLGIAHQLLRNWITSQQNPPPQEMLQEKKQDLRDLFMDEIYAAAGLFGSKRGNASYSQLVLAIATMYDKVRLIDNMPTVIIAAMGELTETADFLTAENIEMSSAVRAWREQLQARKAATKIKQEGVSNG